MTSPLTGSSESIVGSWQPDPFGRYQHRWYDGRMWTDAVATNGAQTTDPAGNSYPAPQAAAPTLPTPAALAPQYSHQSPYLASGYQQLGGPIPTPRRKGGHKVVKGTLLIVGVLFVALAAISIIDPSTDEDPAAAASAMNVVPMLLGPDATHHERSVDVSMLGDEWPLTVPSGTVVCESVPSPIAKLHVFFVDPAGAVYAVNGTARGDIGARGWLDFESIWSDSPTGYGLKVDIGPLIQVGLDICEPAAITDGPLPADLLAASAQVVWASTSPEDRAAMCEGWKLFPDVARESFIGAAEGNDQYWPHMEQLLRNDC